MGHSLLFVAAGGAVGAMLRYGVSVAAVRALGPDWPLGTAAVNILGSFVLGLLVGLGPRMAPGPRLFLGTGLLGAFTTFSTFSVETVALAERGDVAAAVGNVGLNTVIGLMAAGLGLWLGRSVSQG